MVTGDVPVWRYTWAFPRFPCRLCWETTLPHSIVLTARRTIFCVDCKTTPQKNLFPSIAHHYTFFFLLLST